MVNEGVDWRGLLLTARGCWCELIRAGGAGGRCVNPVRRAADPRDPAAGTPDSLCLKVRCRRMEEDPSADANGVVSAVDSPKRLFPCKHLHN